MPRRPSPRTPKLAMLTLAALVIAAGCSPASTPAPTPRVTPTPIAARVATPEDAAALVIATDPRFAGAQPLRPDVIGASKWWTAEPITGGGYRIELTLGWGDCPAGCINRHTWTYEVSPDGTLKLAAEAGDPVPAVLPQ